MPVTYEINPDERLLRTRCVGEVTFPEVVAHFDELERDPGLGGDFDIVLDLTELTSIPTPGQLRAVSTELQRMQPRFAFRACAVVAVSDVLFGLSRMFEAYSEDRFREIRVFRRIDEAEAWLTSR